VSQCQRRDQCITASVRYCTQKLIEVVGDQRATWRLAKELLHSAIDDKPPAITPQDASKLCDGFCRFFADKLKKIADTVGSRLRVAPVYHRHEPCLLDEISEVTVLEVTRLIGSIPPKSSPVDFMPTSLLKSTVHVTVRHGTTNRKTGVFPSSLKQGRVTTLLKKPGLDHRLTWRILGRSRT